MSGTLRGNVGTETLESMVQSYVVTADGRTYTAISHLSPEVGAKLQLAQIIGGTIGWLFAKPVGDFKNGFQLTGGKFNSTGTLHFDGTDHIFKVNQRYNGLNVWDQLALEAEVSGTLPDVTVGAKLQLNDFVEEFTRSGDKISTVSRHNIKVVGEEREIPFTLFHEVRKSNCRVVLCTKSILQIAFESCKYSSEPKPENSPAGTLKSTRISINYDPRERAVRLGALNKIGNTDALNPCDDGTHTCGDNTKCVSTGEDTFDVGRYERFEVLTVQSLLVHL